jgi:hypothetical protein
LGAQRRLDALGFRRELGEPLGSGQHAVDFGRKVGYWGYFWHGLYSSFT